MGGGWLMQVIFKKNYYRSDFQINHGISYQYNMKGDGKLSTIYKINLPERFKYLIFQLK